MQLKEFVALMERIAPPELACEYDNPGLLIGPARGEIRSVLVALDCTPAVAREAAELGADLVLTHHPLFFQAVKRILPDDPQTASAYALIRSGVGLYAAHTNLDAAPGGVNDALAGLLGLNGVTPFGAGIGRVGDLPEPVRLDAFVRRVDALLGTNARFGGAPERVVKRVAVGGGACGDMAADAKLSGADAFLVGEMKHHECIDAETLGLAAVVAGHYETERVVLKPLIERLQRDTHDVQYTLSLADRSPLASS